MFGTLLYWKDLLTTKEPNLCYVCGWAELSLQEALSLRGRTTQIDCTLFLKRRLASRIDIK
jgi:hypothetical protein